ncbi:DUF6113 family protein [Streptomyces sp. RB6PN25]|uniref:DUF6113 family protein n=1 Tax=Streptomyces humicola TaxID=2953240 RepID=A0ABT1PR98_9ACTN|nr:DUF6113 family protein [Streptomyces humicola]MCQ4080192.1 DUF6113 family protein [Streptomyces humicola]
MSRNRPFISSIGYVGLAVLGCLVAVAGALVQDGWFPGGLILALVGTAALFYGGRTLMESRLGAVVPLVAWFLTVMYLSVSRPEGDFLFAAEIGPYIFLLGGMAAGVICATVQRHSPSGPPPSVRGARLGQ